MLYAGCSLLFQFNCCLHPFLCQDRLCQTAWGDGTGRAWAWDGVDSGNPVSWCGSGNHSALINTLRWYKQRIPKARSSLNKTSGQTRTSKVCQILPQGKRMGSARKAKILILKRRAPRSRKVCALASASWERGEQRKGCPRERAFLCHCFVPSLGNDGVRSKPGIVSGQGLEGRKA